jgi:hypothetical protein
MLRTKLRVILFQWKGLVEPLPIDEVLTPLPEGTPRYRVRGGESVEAIQARVIDFAGLVWQVKDGLINWLADHPTLKLPVGPFQIAGGSRAVTSVEEWAKLSLPLMLCADLYNTHKHYDDCNRSGHKPFLNGVAFDGSKAGAWGIYYNGARKTGDLLVTNRMPVPMRVELHSGTQPVDFGDAVIVIGNGFRHWIPVIRGMGLLAPNGLEDRAILDDLANMEAQVDRSSPFRAGDEVVDFKQLSTAEQKLARSDPAAFIKSLQMKAAIVQPPHAT